MKQKLKRLGRLVLTNLDRHFWIIMALVSLAFKFYIEAAILTVLAFYWKLDAIEELTRENEAAGDFSINIREINLVPDDAKAEGTL